MKPLRIEALGKDHDRSGFRSEVKELDTYFSTQASQDVKRRVAAVFVLVDEDYPKRILGYYSLSSFAIWPSELPETMIRKLPRYPTIPATLIGRLARDLGAPGTGGLLLADAFNRILSGSFEIASALVVVEATGPEAVAFYQKFGFITFLDDSRNLFLPAQTIAAGK